MNWRNWKQVGRTEKSKKQKAKGKKQRAKSKGQKAKIGLTEDPAQGVITENFLKSIP
jgi:hypothetical protein